MYVTQSTVINALRNLYGTAGHLFKIWLVLKQMGFQVGNPEIEIDTANSTESLQRLFSCGAADGCFYVPFAHTPRYLTMKHDASRSIIQTTIQRWCSSGSVVTCDPTEFIDITPGDGSRLHVKPSRRYPMGLGVDESGFALADGTRVSVPLSSFSVWYGRQTEIPDGVDGESFLQESMLAGLNISPAEKPLVFVEDAVALSFQAEPLTDPELYSACESFINGEEEVVTEVVEENIDNYTRRVRGMVSNLSLPVWLRSSPEEEVESLLGSGANAILLYGPPRTGKTRLIDNICARSDPSRETIQIHDGWGYDHLVQGLKPDSDGNWVWVDGPLKSAVESGKKIVVLEEVNRTQISQSLGEIFSLIEDAYRGEDYSITLRDGSSFFIPSDVVIFMTMNTIDKSTEEVDDALLGRMAAVEFPPRPEDLQEMLGENGVQEDQRQKLSELFAGIIDIYPLGHGYFSGLKGVVSDGVVLTYYKSRVRPVLFNFLGELKQQELTKIDNIVDELFGAS